MARAGQGHETLTAEQEFDRLNVDSLRPLAALVTRTPAKKKGELVAALPSGRSWTTWATRPGNGKMALLE